MLGLFARRPLGVGIPVALVTHALAAVLGAVFWHAAPAISIPLPFTSAEIPVFAGGSGARLAAAGERERGLVSDLAEAVSARDSWSAAFDQSEIRRAEETAAGRTAVADLVRDHAAALEAARNAGANAVRVIYQEPEYDENNCPRRDLLGADQLRDAIGALGPG